MLEHFKDIPVHVFKTHFWPIFIKKVCRYVVTVSIAVTEVVLITSSDKNEFKGKYWREWLMVRLGGRRRPRATWRDNCTKWMENTKYENLVRMADVSSNP